ncbi:MAG: phospholipid carrier-dependent glycosyltransferase [FCB group bacterium]|nr:phospholipid carrier-dependent glycosyltransferase [FCB group bacterium]
MIQYTKNVRVYLGFLKSRLDLQCLLIFALILRFGYLLLMLGQVSGDEIMGMIPDSGNYVGIARGLIDIGPADENSILIYGPGYGYFLGCIFFLFGVGPFAVILIQIILSSVSCLLIYKLGRDLTGSKAVGIVAGLLSATSFTSISLASIVLSDTLFFFLFLSGNLLFLHGLKNERRLFHVGAGVAIGCAILVRSIGQFWPLAMLLFIFILPFEQARGWQWKKRLHLIKTAGIAPLIALLIMSAWMTRNYSHYSVPVVAFTSAGGPANIAAQALAQIENREAGDIQAEWFNEYTKATGDEDVSYIDKYRISGAAARSVFYEHPGEMIDVYRALIWENLNTSNELYRSQLPAYKWPIVAKMNWLRERSFFYLCFWLCMGGFFLMVLLRKWRLLMVTGIIYIYFAMMIGFTQWQGSRLFYPGQIAWTIVISFFIIMTLRFLKPGFKWIGQSILRYRQPIDRDPYPGRRS